MKGDAGDEGYGGLWRGMRGPGQALRGPGRIGSEKTLPGHFRANVFLDPKNVFLDPKQE